MNMIQTDKLVFEYDKRDEDGNIIGKSRAIDEVDIDVKEGQFIAILGHNGSGKSTFAKPFCDRPLEEQKMKKVTVDTKGVEYPAPERV